MFLSHDETVNLTPRVATVDFVAPLELRSSLDDFYLGACGLVSEDRAPQNHDDPLQRTGRRYALPGRRDSAQLAFRFVDDAASAEHNLQQKKPDKPGWKIIRRSVSPWMIFPLR